MANRCKVARELAAIDTSQGQSFPEIARKFAAKNLDIIDEYDSKWPHNLGVSRAEIPHLEKVYANLRRQLKRGPEDKMEDLKLNTFPPAIVAHPQNLLAINVFRCNLLPHAKTLPNQSVLF